MKITKLFNYLILRGIKHFLREYEGDPAGTPILLPSTLSVFIPGCIFRRNPVVV